MWVITNKELRGSVDEKIMLLMTIVKDLSGDLVEFRFDANNQGSGHEQNLLLDAIGDHSKELKRFQGVNGMTV